MKTISKISIFILCTNIFSSCGPSVEEKAAMEKAKRDSIDVVQKRNNYEDLGGETDAPLVGTTNSNNKQTPGNPDAQPTLAESMSPEKAFCYYLALFHLSQTSYSKTFEDGTPEDYITAYANAFDQQNFLQSKSDEFEKNSYRERIKAKITDEVNKINFNDKFVSMFSGELGEYSFSEHAFPISSLNSTIQLDVFPASGGLSYKKITLNGVDDQVDNKNDISWSLKMPDDEASNFIKSRKDNRGEINRTVYFKIVYSILNKIVKDYKNGVWLKSYFYSIEVYADQAETKFLGKLIINGISDKSNN